MKRTEIPWVAVLLVLVAACSAAREPNEQSAYGKEGPTTSEVGSPDVLSPGERALAVELVRSSDRTAEVYATDRPVYVVDLELIRSKEGAARRIALVTQYRYEGNVAVRSVVDLTARRVIEVEMTPDLPVSFAAEELARATELALGNERLRGVMEDNLSGFAEGRPGYEIQGLGVRAASPEDSIYGHRVVSLLFEMPDGYVTGVEVLVDLTTETVEVRRTEGDYR